MSVIAVPVGSFPIDFSESLLSRALHQLLLSLFLPIQDDGWSPSALARTTSWTVAYNHDLTQCAVVSLVMV
jgi:hypothetical protein